MLKLKDFRAVYPEYNDLTDYELSTALHRTHFADVPYEQFAQNFGGPLQEDKAAVAARDYNAANPEHPITAQDIRDKDRSGILGSIRLLGEGIYDAVTDQFPEDMARAWRGGDIDPANPGVADSIIRQQTKDNAARIPSLQEAEGDTWANSLYQGPRSIATSLATGIAGSMAGGAAGGAAGSVVPGVGTAAGGVLGGMLGGATMSGAAFYRMAKDQFVDEVQQAMQRSMGRTMTSEEAAELNKAIDADATEYGLWEAGPEAISQFFTLGLIKGAGGMALKKFGLGAIADAIGKRSLTRIPAKMGAELGEEETTEGITYFGQEGIRQRYGLRDTAPSVGEFAATQAGPVAVGSLLQLGGMRAAEAIGHRMRRRADDVNANADETPEDAPPPEAQSLSEHDVTPAAPYVFEQSPENMPVPVSPGEFISDADAADIDAFVRDYEVREQAQADAAMLSEYGRPASQRFMPVQLALEAGQPVDLLALPQNAAGVAQGIGGLALPPGTGSIPMGTDASSRGSIAPPTDFAGAPLATPFTPRPALPQQAGPSAGQGRWSGGRSQLVYGGGMMQGLGFMGEQARTPTAPVQLMPTASQITNTQTAPRADTTAQATALGMPAPNPLAPGIDAAEGPAVQTSTMQNTAMDPQSPMRGAAVPPATPQGYNYYLPSFVTAQYARPKVKTEGASNSPAPQAKQAAVDSRESRADLLQQLPPESRKEARRLTNTQLRERVRAEQNPVKFDGETIAYTAEDYPMPTAQSGTVFTSASGRRLSPFPKVDYSTPRKHKASNAKVAAWLLDEARKEAAPNAWRSLLIRDRKAGNLSPADVRDLVDILSNGVEEETTPQFFKPVPAAVEPQGEGKRETQEEKKREESAEGAPKIGPEKRPAKKIAEPENGASEAGSGVVKSDAQAAENKLDAVENKELSHAPTDAQGSGVDDSGSHEEHGSEDVSRADGKRETGRSGTDTGRSDRGELRGQQFPDQMGTPAERVERPSGTDSLPDHGLQQRLERGAADGDRVRRGTADRGSRRGRGSVSGLNYNAPVGALARTGSWKETAARNLDIIELSKRLDEEKRAATPEEQALLAQYVGWGPADIRNKLFPSTNSSRREINPYAVSPEWRPLAERAAEILSPEEVATAFQSTQYAHYTSEPMIRAIWSGLQRLGFKGGNILEPGMGTGLFAVAAPANVMGQSKYTGVEMDKATARIARHLLPEANILNADFVKQKLPDNFFDLAVGNPPFSATKILDDPAYKKHRFLLHDYFFAKSLDKVRPGGLLVFVTSKGTMDKADDKARAYMAERADLLGAIRLPQTAFKQNAGTEVVTDVLFLRKRQPGEAPGGEAWLKRAEVKTPEGPALVNEYFARHPGMVLGEHSLRGSMYRSDEYTVLPRGTDIDAQFADAVTHLPENVYSPDVRSSADSVRRQTAERDFNPKHTKEGALYVDDKGVLRRLDNGSGVDINTVAKLTDSDREWLKDYVELRDALKQAQYDQLHDGDWEASLKKLNRIYDAFVKKHGFINEFKEYERTAKSKDGEEVTTSYRRFKRQKLLGLDVESSLADQLEKITDDGRIVKQPFLLDRTIKRSIAPQIKNINDALMVSLDQRGTLDLDHVAELADKDRNAVIKELGDAVYEVPGADWQMADEYLSGDVVTKLEEAEAAAVSDERFRRNVEALRKVQPKPLEAKNISVGLGAPWVPTEHLDAFAKEALGLNLHIRYNKDSGTFSVPDANRRSARSGTSEWGTPDRSPQEILSAVLNNQSITIRVKDSDGKTRTDDTATTEANEKADKMRKAFESWIWQDAKRAGELVKIYNRTFNNIAPRRFDGSHLTLPGLSLRYKLYDHQKRAIWRIIQTGNVYLAHAVGAGKTLEMIVSGMEQRRLGLIQRPMYVVPNHMLRQFSSEFQDAYPLARIMVADEENFTGDNRRRFVAQAALNAPDAIVITHSAFKRIGTRPETIEAVTKDFIAQLEEAIEDSDDRISRSRLEQRLEQAKRRTEARFSKSKDQAVFFEDMGVDFLYVDEAHGFRKLDFVTNRDRVKGIDPSGSEMALDLYSKLEWLRREHPGRSHVLASGTPVTNTMAELYTVMRYMDPEGLERDGLSSFDAWATMFGRVKADLEQNASGTYETVERFAKFVNVPELMKRVRGFMDVLTMSQLGDLVKRPDLKTGQPINVVAQASPAVLDYLKNVLAPRIQASKKWRPSASQKGNPDPIVRIITDGRLAALDLRFVSDLAENDPHSKLNLMIDDIIKTYHAVADRVYTNPETGQADAMKGGTQIIFSSVGFGEQVAARRGFNLRGFMMQRFKEGGIPASQVAWMGDYKTHAKKEAMFKDMRAGKIRLLIGSPQNMGTGVNVQKRLFKLHYLSPPWFPADVEQPHGRILRQGNQNPEVEINWYATKGTYDSTMWGMVARKARFIEQAFTGDDSVRTLDDISESSQYEMAAALAAGDERAIQLAGLNSDIERLSRLEQAHAEEQMRFKSRRRDIEFTLDHEARERAKLQAALEILGDENISADNFRLLIGKETYVKQKEAGEALLTAAERELAAWTPSGAKARESVGIGSAQGKCPLVLHMDVGETGNGRIGKRLRSLEVRIGKLSLEVQDFTRDEPAPQGIATRLVNRLNGVARGILESKARESDLRKEMDSLQRRTGVPFPQEGELHEKIAEAARIQAELEEEGKKQNEADQQEEKEEDAGGMASLAPGEYLPPRRENRLHLRPAAVQRVADALGKTAKNAAPVRVVQRFEDLPAGIRQKHAGSSKSVEGVYDPRSRTVWLVADNLSDPGRVAEVWAHEQIVHHGLRGLLSDAERKAVLNQLWAGLGGMDNATIREIADKYGLNPRADEKARQTVMEETIAALAERRQFGALTPQEARWWRRIVAAVTRAWERLVRAATGREARMKPVDIDGLLSALGRYVMEGASGRGLGGNMAENSAMASVLKDQSGDTPLASLSPRSILDMTMRGTAKAADSPEIRHLFKRNDISLLQGIIQLPHWIAKQAPEFSKVYERQLQRMDERSAALKMSLETVPSMFGKQRLEAADMDSLRKLLWEHEGKEPKELEGIEKFLTEETLATGRELIKVNPEFYDAYKKWLGGLDGTKAAKAAMLEIRKSLDEDLVLAHNRMAAMSEMSDDAIRKFRQSIGHVPNYFPHHRYGDYFVQAKVGDEVVFRQHFDALGEKAAMAKARKIVEKQRENYPGVEWTDGKNDRLPDEVLGAPIDSGAMEQIIRAATAKIGDKERAGEIADLLTEGVADVLKARGWGAHGIQRKGIPGFERQDIARVLYDYKAGLNGWLTKMEAARDFSEALSKIDARKTPHLWKYTAQYVKDMLRNSDRVDRITGNIKTVAFAWYLGGSIKTAFVNATQNLVVGVPRLQMDVTGGGREWLAGARSALVDRVTGNQGKGLTEEEARLVRELYGESVITDAFMEEVRGQLRGVSGASLWNKFTKVLGWPMSEVERFNRASLALAAFRAARTGKLKARAREKYGVKGKANYEQAKAFASDVVRDAHFVYGKSNMPEFMRSNTAGRAMASMYTFRTFTHNMVAMWAWALKTQGKEGAAFVAKSLGATMALGGVTALPLYATLMALFQAVTGDDDDWTELIRSHLPESNLLRDVVCYGTPAMAGVNIGGSLKMETPLTKGLTGGKTPQEVLTDSIGDIIGIPYDLLVVKPSRVMEAHSKGNTWRMLEEAAPVAVKNGMQAWRLYSEGQTTMTGRPINDPGEKGARRLSSGESFGKLLGFQPVSSTKSYDAYAATKHADQVRSDKIDELTVLALKTYDTGDSAGRREANRELREWNEKMKAEGKPHMLINLKDVMRRVKSRRRENRATPKAMQKRERQQAVWG